MSGVNISNALQYVNENKEYLAGYKSAESAVTGTEPYSGLFEITRYDTFEKAEEMKELRTENYLNFTKIRSMPKSIFGDAFGREMQEEIQEYMSDYYAGTKDVENVQDAFRKCCMAMRVYRAKNLETSGQDEMDNKQTVGQIFELFSKCNQRAALKANQAEGVSINQEYGGDHCGNANAGYVYYNSDYFYECESMRDVLRNMTDEMQREWGLSEIDVKEIEENTIYTVDGGLDFHSGWNWKNRNNLEVGSMIDERKVPPKDFCLFFNPTAGKTEFGGVLRFETENIFMEMEVPFEYKGNDILNVSELLKVECQDKTSRNGINEFLKNFEIFTKTQGVLTGITSVRGNYQAKF